MLERNRQENASKTKQEKDAKRGGGCKECREAH